ncbi:MAG: hypothetical protein A3D65_02650 [Candidatus Lloydbacteria bacterium RIFCSPHIGHO2_02_FULL_50_13]|uniref:Uncharacterized protein n=1 Tax=Candidatus Lloydbacteria bacterium RIFCSPHIGHO2_02_FULL_50_13 TaxID=1798661 RepID=A0A1G2D5M6_9BACT|nr:MAG: hypothetical protein A3D65_02650 [Candidatus Lloydbacteria bacterium RIFCSPHIGHO2_02_FULL_50_13]
MNLFSIIVVGVPILAAMLGLAIGYLVKPIVLSIVTVPATVSTIYLLLLMFSPDSGPFTSTVASWVVATNFLLVVPMWLVYVVKRTNTGKAFLVWLKEKTIV